jgi:hypothetical protein
MDANFATAVGLGVGGVVVAALWKISSKNDPPDAEDLAMGFDLFAAALVLQISFIAGSQSAQVTLRWIGLASLFFLPLVMGVFMRFFGYEKTSLGGWEMTTRTAVVTSITGGLALPACWLVNVYATEVIHLWKSV